jgi:hypothetical protein
MAMLRAASPRVDGLEPLDALGEAVSGREAHPIVPAMSVGGLLASRSA